MTQSTYGGRPTHGDGHPPRDGRAAFRLLRLVAHDRRDRLAARRPLRVPDSRDWTAQEILDREG